MEDGALLSESLQQELGRSFEIGFYEAALRTEPDHVEALHALGHLYTEAGRYEEGLAIDQRLAQLVPEEPIVHYNLGCSLALTGQPTAALDALERAIELGYDDAEHMAADPDLASLRDLPRFDALLERIVANRLRSPRRRRRRGS
ncbi:MAG: hypothetical protein D6776_08545 [Planctomycetota bacterium]|nr:MAG: hypothetical protein D6776_08545 [Planctomycetota bacterium]